MDDKSEAAKDAEIARLRWAIEKAPHANECHNARLEHQVGHVTVGRGEVTACPGCDCWKAAALAESVEP